MEKTPTKASTVYTTGMFVYSDETDVVPATTSTQNNIRGILQESKASAANTNEVHMLVPNSTAATFYGDVTGTLTKAMEGDQFDFAAGGLTVAQATSTYDVLTLVKFISASKGIFKLNVLHGKD